jgi:hypothetical protein
MLTRLPTTSHKASATNLHLLRITRRLEPGLRPGLPSHRALSVTQRARSVTQRALSVTQRALSVTQRALSVTQRALSVTQRALRVSSVTRRGEPVAANPHLEHLARVGADHALVEGPELLQQLRDGAPRHVLEEDVQKLLVACRAQVPADV